MSEKMLYKTELHAHTSPVSRCAHADPETLVKRFTEKGYTTVVLQNHLNRWTFETMSGIGWEEMMRYYLEGYHALRDAARGKLNILLGAEMRVDEFANDFLVFGLTEEKLFSLGEIFPLRFRELSKKLGGMGCLVYQAHPMRFGMTLLNPEWDGHLDGIEVYNSHKNHDSHNDLALLWAEKLSLPGISGSDFHDPEGYIGGGILTEEPVTGMDQLLNILKSGNYRLIRE